MAMSNYTEERMIKANYNNTAPALPTAWYLALFSAYTNDETKTELSGNGYARVVWTPTTSSGGAISNNAEIAFAAATADWPSVTHVAVFDAITVGNELDWGAMTTPRTVLDTGVLKFATGELDVAYD